MSVTYPTQVSANGNNASPSITVPTVSTNDILLIAFTQGNTDLQTVTPGTANLIENLPSSTTQLITKTYWIPVDGSTIHTGVALAFTLSATRQWGLNLLVIRGADNTTPINAHNSTTANTATGTAPSLSVTGLPVVELASCKSNGTTVTSWTAPSGWTASSIQAGNTTFSPSTVWGTDNTNPATGTFGAETWTPNATPNIMQRFVYSINPAASGTPNAGPDQTTVEPFSTVTLDGSGSTSATTYLWRQISGTTVTLSSTTTVGPTFTAPASMTDQTLVFGLKVNGGATEDTVSITILQATEAFKSAGGVWTPMQIVGL